MHETNEGHRTSSSAGLWGYVGIQDVAQVFDHAEARAASDAGQGAVGLSLRERAAVLVFTKALTLPSRLHLER